MSIICGSEYADISEEKLRNWSLSSKDGGASIKPMLVSKAAVIGLGTMGRGIAISLLRAGKHVLVFEMNKAALESGVKALHFILDRLFLRKIINEDEMNKMKSFIQPSHNYEDLHEVDLVIEAVFEELKLKTTIFSKLDKVCKPTAILASNTSALDIDDIADATSRPGKVIGMHFFAPAHLMRLLENVRGTRSSPETIVTAMDLGKQMNKVTVLVGNCEGFVGNRMYFHYMHQADFLLEEGAYPHQVDKVLTDYGFAMGRYEVGDLSGNDVGYRVRAKQGLTPRQQPHGAPERSRNGVRYCPLSDYLVESGRHGQKTNGKGWYKYVPGNRAPQVDSDVTKLIDDYRKRFNIQPRKIQDQEVIERLLYPMINEGFKILEDGIAENPWDIDMVWLHGYAWPRRTGGPMYYAYTVGLPQVLKVIEEHWKAAGASEPHWQPSTMLTWLVENHGNPDISQWMPLMQKHKSKTSSKL